MYIFLITELTTKNNSLMNNYRYQSADVGNFLSQSLLESQYHYQTSIEESVVVIYDTKKSARGFLTLKAYRLTPQVRSILCNYTNHLMTRYLPVCFVI